MGLVLITHDMGVVAEIANRVIVQYAGRQVETNDTAALFADRHHPYTEALLAALPERAHGAPAAGHPGRRAGPVRPAAGLRVRAALRLRLRPLPRRSSRPRPARELGRALCHIPLVDGQPTPPRLEAFRSRRHAAERRQPPRHAGARGARPQPRLRRSSAACSGQPATVKALAGVSLHARAGRDAGGGRRVGLRQVDPEPPAHPDRAADRRHAC